MMATLAIDGWIRFNEITGCKTKEKEKEIREKKTKKKKKNEMKTNNLKKKK